MPPRQRKTKPAPVVEPEAVDEDLELDDELEDDDQPLPESAPPKTVDDEEDDAPAETGQDGENPVELEAVDEADDEDDDEERSGNTFTAKQIASRIGTDAKTLRKFFRSSASTVEPVGQGGRYEFAVEDLAKIKEEFEKAGSGGTSTRKPKADGEPTADKAPRSSRTRKAKAAEVVVEEDTEELDLDDEEPSADDLSELEDLELDDEDEV